MPANEQNLFALKIEDSLWVKKLARTVRLLLKRPTITPFQIAGIADLLFALERLPASTLDAEVSLSVSTRYGDNLASFGIMMEGEYFTVETVEGFYTRGVGGDTEARTVFAADTSGGRTDTEPEDIEFWLEGFAELAKDTESNINVEWNGSSCMDESSKPDPSLWEECPSDYA